MKQNKKHTAKPIEAIVHGIFLVAGLITVGCVLLITVYHPLAEVLPGKPNNR